MNMKQSLVIAVIAIAAFLLGTLMPRTPKVEEKVITKVERDTIIHTQIKSVPVHTEHWDTTYIYVNSSDTVWVKDTMWLGLPRQHYFAETDDVKIWHSGVDSRIDSLVNFRETKTILPEPWKRHSVGVSADIGFNLLGVGAEYEYSPFKWFSINASAGYDFYMKQPYAMAGAKITLYRW